LDWLTTHRTATAHQVSSRLTSPRGIRHSICQAARRCFLRESRQDPSRRWSPNPRAVLASNPEREVVDQKQDPPKKSQNTGTWRLPSKRKGRLEGQLKGFDIYTFLGRAHPARLRGATFRAHRPAPGGPFLSTNGIRPPKKIWARKWAPPLRPFFNYSDRGASEFAGAVNS